MSNQEVYARLIEWLNGAWWGLPDSEHLMPTIMTFYTPEEAALLTGIPFAGTNLGELAEIKDMDPAELGPKLDALAQRGAVWRTVRGDAVRYSLNDTMFTFLRGPYWAAEPDEATVAATTPLNKYFFDGFMDQFADAHTKGLRTLPIHETIEDPRQILPYEDVVKFVEAQDFHVATHCPCRQRKNLDPDSQSCDHPTEVCLHFGPLGHYIVENGLGREITQEETLAILKQAADSGLVHAVSNWEQGADTICNCCNCCCLFMDAYHVLGHSKSHDVSNYRVRTNAATCKGCAHCVRRCPVDAMQLKTSAQATNKFRKAAMMVDDRCIGCGVCVHQCPTDSLILERREEIYAPPRDGREWMERWREDNRVAQA
jgi:Na+-translocating ferredoxin:NAD+ oxidoreductase RNF subunit RnfB